MHFKKRLILVISFFSLLFFLAIGFDIPYLRGPAPDPIEWQWPYLFINTLHKIFPSLILIFIILFLFNIFDKLKEEEIGKYERFFLPLIVLLGFLFQLSVIHFSRAGLFVLLERTINPGANGYFTASLNIQNISTFLREYNQIVPSFVMHAHGHPPGAILLYYFVNSFCLLFPSLNNFVNSLVASTKPINNIWITLLPFTKSGAIFASLLIPFISSLISIPLYYLAKKYHDSKTGLRSILLYTFTPSIILFTPLPDVYFTIFPILTFLSLLAFYDRKNISYLFLAGVFLALGIFFSLSILTFVLMSFLIILIKFEKIQKKFKEIVYQLIYFFSGIITPFILLYLFFKFNIIEVANTTLSLTQITIAHRSYFIWLFYNPYDLLVFSGIPIFILFIYILKEFFNKLSFNKLRKNYLLSSFLITFLILNFSGNVRGETARLLIPFIPFLILISFSYLKKINLTTRDFLFILFFQAIQVLIMQEFWVPLW